jgi:predicted TPR repeat methyltransferase
MPYSVEENKSWAHKKIRQINPQSVLDVGAGAGAYGKIVRSINPEIELDCIEVWTPYINQFDLGSIYRNVFNYEAKDHKDWNYDLVIFGDVLEHMTKKQALELYELAAAGSPNILFSIPIIHLPQGAEHGNPYETHVEDHWKHEDILKDFRNVVDYSTFSVTGIYLAEF